MIERAMLALFEGKTITRAQIGQVGEGAGIILSFSDDSKAQIPVGDPARVTHIAPNAPACYFTVRNPEIAP